MLNFNQSFAFFHTANCFVVTHNFSSSSSSLSISHIQKLFIVRVRFVRKCAYKIHAEISLFITYHTQPLVNACSQTYWQLYSIVPPKRILFVISQLHDDTIRKLSREPWTRARARTRTLATNCILYELTAGNARSHTHNSFTPSLTHWLTHSLGGNSKWRYFF